MSTIKVAAAQIQITKDPQKNTETITEYIRQAGRQNCDIVCFPEACLFFDVEDVEDSTPFLDKICSTAKEHRIWVIFGTYEKKEGKFANVAYLINREGKTVYKYQKKNLWVGEEETIEPGSHNEIITTELGNIGIIICFDFASANWVGKLKGADIIFCPSFMKDYEGRIEVVKAFPVMRAFENLSYFVLCDAFDQKTASLSIIADPFHVLVQQNKEGLLIQTLDLEKLKQIQQSFGKD